MKAETESRLGKKINMFYVIFSRNCDGRIMPGGVQNHAVEKEQQCC
jgi:hypothetical protein